MERKMKNQKGIALIQGVILMGLIGLVSAVVVNYSQKNQEESQRSQRLIGARMIPEMVEKNLFNQTLCKRAFSLPSGIGMTLNDEGGSREISLRDEEGGIILGEGKNIRGVKINKIEAKYPSHSSWTSGEPNQTMAQLEEIAVHLSYNVGTSTQKRIVKLNKENLPYLVKDATKKFLRCDYTLLTVFSEALKESCENIGGLYSPGTCNLSHKKIEGLDPSAGEKSLAILLPFLFKNIGVGAKSSWDYFDSRFLRLRTGGVFQKGQSLEFQAPLYIEQGGKEKGHLINVEQAREALQNICKEGGIGVITPSGITCENLECGHGEFFTGFSAEGKKLCRPILSSEVTGCETYEDFKLLINTSGQVSIECEEKVEWKVICDNSACENSAQVGTACSIDSQCSVKTESCKAYCRGVMSNKDFPDSKCSKQKPADSTSNCPNSPSGLVCQSGKCGVKGSTSEGSEGEGDYTNWLCSKAVIMGETWKPSGTCSVLSGGCKNNQLQHPLGAELCCKEEPQGSCFGLGGSCGAPIPCPQGYAPCCDGTTWHCIKDSSGQAQVCPSSS